jgi:putative phosphoribosyl transferase
LVRGIHAFDPPTRELLVLTQRLAGIGDFEMAHDPLGAAVPLIPTLRIFKDRRAAGEQLAERLQSLLARPSVIAAIPRGGIAVALPIVERLRRPLAIVHACKLTAPAAPELAFGALDEDGQVAVDRQTVARLELGPEVIASATARVEAEIRRRIALYKGLPLAQCLPGLDVILVDDGLATGLTMHAAVDDARRHGAREITVAVPCASQGAAVRFRQKAHRFVSLIVGDAFGAVGGYYADFTALTDEEVSAMLARVEKRSP